MTLTWKQAVIERLKSDPVAIARGLIPGAKLIEKFGRNVDIDTGTVPEDVWDGGGVYTGFPTGAAELVTVVSSSTDDAAAGTGARTVQISGLGESYGEQTETLTLNGTTLVDSTKLWTRVNMCRVLTSGSSNQAFNVGALTVAHKTTTANVFTVVPAGFGQSQVGCSTIPAGKTGILDLIDVGKQRSNSATADGGLWVREFGFSPRVTNLFSISQNNNFQQDSSVLVFPEKTDIAVRITQVSTSNTEVFANFNILLYDNN